MMKNSSKVFLFLLLPLLAFAQWEKITIHSDASFRGLKKYKNHIWASGTKGTVIHSTDDGKTYQVQQIKGAENLDFRDICILNEKTILLMSAGLSEKGAAKLFRTKDAGKTWKIVLDISTPGFFFDALQYDPNTKKGMLVSDPVDGQFKFFSFDSLGETFTAIDLKDFPRLLPKEAAFAASGSSLLYKNGIATLITGGSKYARIIQSQKENLQNWKVKNQTFEADSSSGFFSIAAKNRNELLVAGGNYLKLNENKIPILKSNDAGETWNKIDNNPNFYIEKVIWSKPYWIMTGPSETATYHNKTKEFKSLGKSNYHNIIEHKGYLIGVGGKGEVGRIKLK